MLEKKEKQLTDRNTGKLSYKLNNNQTKVHFLELLKMDKREDILLIGQAVSLSSEGYPEAECSTCIF